MQKLVNRRAVTIGGVQISERIEGEAERIDLAPRVLLDARAVDLDAVGIAGVHLDRAGPAIDRQRQDFEARAVALGRGRPRSAGAGALPLAGGG